MGEELKPCPFHSHTFPLLDPKLIGVIVPKRKAYENNVCYVFCAWCHAQGPLRETRDEAIAAWNRRAVEDTK